MIYIKVYEFKVDDYDFTMVVDKDDISIHVTTPETFPFPADILYFKNDNGDSPAKNRSNCSLEELAEEVNITKDPDKELWWQEYKLNHKQQYLNEMTASLNKTFNSKFKIIEI